MAYDANTIRTFTNIKDLANGEAETLASLVFLRRTSDASIRVSFVDDAGYSVDATGSNQDTATLSISSTAKSLPQFMVAAGFCSGAAFTIPGLPNRAVEAIIEVVSGDLVWNFSGTPDGSAGGGNGIQSTRPSPSTSSPFRAVAGQIISFGRSR